MAQRLTAVAAALLAFLGVSPVGQAAHAQALTDPMRPPQISASERAAEAALGAPGPSRLNSGTPLTCGGMGWPASESSVGNTSTTDTGPARRPAASPGAAKISGTCSVASCNRYPCDASPCSPRPSPWSETTATTASPKPACALVARGAPEQALAEFDAILASDPGNVQVAYWRGRAFKAMKRLTDAAAAYRKAFDIGFRSLDCVHEALFCSVTAIHDGAAENADTEPAWTAATSFLAAARAKGVPEHAWTYLFEVGLYLPPRHRDLAKARQALANAERAPGADALREQIERARLEIEAAERQSD